MNELYQLNLEVTYLFDIVSNSLQLDKKYFVKIIDKIFFVRYNDKKYFVKRIYYVIYSWSSSNGG